MDRSTERPLNHGVMFNALRPYMRWYLGVDPLGSLSAVDWLSMSEAHLAHVVGGRVFHDGTGDLTRLRQVLL